MAFLVYILRSRLPLNRVTASFTFGHSGRVRSTPVTQATNMARPKCDFLSGGGIVFNIVKALVDATIEQGGTPDDVHAILTKEGATKLKRIAQILAEKPAKAEPPPIPEPVITPYKLTVDYSRPLADVVEDGKFNWCNEDFNQKNFPVVGEGIVEEELYTIHFQRKLSDEALVAECKRLGYEIIGNTEGAHFGAKFPELQRQYPIIFGSAWECPDGYLRRPCLYGDDTGRDLDLNWFDPGNVWLADCRVLVRKIRNSVAR